MRKDLLSSMALLVAVLGAPPATAQQALEPLIPAPQAVAPNTSAGEQSASPSADGSAAATDTFGPQTEGARQPIPQPPIPQATMPQSPAAPLPSFDPGRPIANPQPVPAPPGYGQPMAPPAISPPAAYLPYVAQPAYPGSGPSAPASAAESTIWRAAKSGQTLSHLVAEGFEIVAFDALALGASGQIRETYMLRRGKSIAKCIDFGAESYCLMLKWPTEIQN